jgi:hypothetical protein
MNCRDNARRETRHSLRLRPHQHQTKDGKIKPSSKHCLLSLLRDEISVSVWSHFRQTPSRDVELQGLVDQLWLSQACISLSPPLDELIFRRAVLDVLVSFSLLTDRRIWKRLSVAGGRGIVVAGI